MGLGSKNWACGAKPARTADGLASGTGPLARPLGPRLLLSGNPPRAGLAGLQSLGQLSQIGRAAGHAPPAARWRRGAEYATRGRNVGALQNREPHAGPLRQARS